MIRYTNTTDGVSADQLQGFFVDWPNPPSPERHLELLNSSYAVELAVDSENNQVVGFITAVSDGVLSAYIPLLEVLPSHKGKGIGTELVKRMLERLSRFYMVDLLCDTGLQSFYTKLGMSCATGMMIRNYQMQCGSEPAR